MAVSGAYGLPQVIAPGGTIWVTAEDGKMGPVPFARIWTAGDAAWRDKPAVRTETLFAPDASKPHPCSLSGRVSKQVFPDSRVTLANSFESGSVGVVHFPAGEYKLTDPYNITGPLAPVLTGF